MTPRFVVASKETRGAFMPTSHLTLKAFWGFRNFGQPLLPKSRKFFPFKRSIALSLDIKSFVSQRVPEPSGPEPVLLLLLSITARPLSSPLVVETSITVKVAAEAPPV